MRAAVIHAPGDLRIETLATPEMGPRSIKLRVDAGGICGSDLHYYQHGGFGTVRIKEPMILGHEVAGTVAQVGDDVAAVKPGDRIAVNPSRPCRQCRYCLEGNPNQCLDMRFYGSAMRFPHVQGAFCDELVIEERQAVPVGAATSSGEAAFAEPLAVALHAIRQAGPLIGRRVLVTGCGPIGCLSIIAARRAGALEVLATDILDEPLAAARTAGADRTVNVARSAEALADFTRDKGYFDVAIEASGNAAALTGAMACVRPRGVIVQLGLGGDAALSLNTLVAKEIELRGTFRFHEEFEWAVAMIDRKLIDVRPLLTASLPLARAREAFELAGDRRKAMKVQLSFE
ncbi:MAG TPA: L-idonate 5-dehydrogenase [Alphaproteobacteria bacterium]|nr:L-idonate 5-dehydrogenase [Alphaproteobacteria bacterium]